MKKYGVVVQARLESTRLPGKIIKPFYQNWSILDIVLMRLKTVHLDGPIILATGEMKKNGPLEHIARRHEVDFFSGSENDVLTRFIDSSEQFNLEKVVRVCCDNPFLDIGLFNQMVTHQGEYDYLSYRVNQKPAILSHYGFFTEMISVEALRKIPCQADIDPLDKEHVTRYIYSHPEKFRIEYIQVPLSIENAKNIRLTVDTEGDFRNAGKVMDKILNGRSELNYNYEDVLRAAAEIPGLNSSMKNQIQANTK